MKKQVKLLRLVIRNFKGIKSLNINLYDRTNISAKNGRGKTTTMDAFLWLLFGKNAMDEKDFSIKNTKDTELNKLDHEVEATLLVDGQELKLRKVYREKWVTKRGSSIEELAGNETECFINDVPKKIGEFNAFISTIMEEKVFKIVTNPFYFNRLKWEERRAVLGQLANINLSESEWVGEFQNRGNKVDYLLKVLSEGKSFADAKAQLSASKKLLKDEKDQLPSRIDEVVRMAPVGENFSELAVAIDTYKQGIESLQKNIDGVVNSDAEARNQVATSQNQLSQLETKLRTLKEAQGAETRNKIKDLESKIYQSEHALRQEEDKLRVNEERVGKIVNRNKYINEVLPIKQTQKEELIAKWKTIQAEVFTDNSSHDCPTCKRPLDGAMLETEKGKLVAEFNNNKSRKLQEIDAQGKQLAAEIKALTDEFNESQKIAEEFTTWKSDFEKALQAERGAIGLLKQSLETLVNSTSIAFEPTPEILELQAQIENWKHPEFVPSEKYEQYKAELAELQNKLQGLNTRMAVKDQIERTNERKKELETRLNLLAGELASIDGNLYQIDEFTTFKALEIERKVNSLFAGTSISFKMFDKQLNGGLDPTCQCYVNGVPFEDANFGAGGRTWGGIEVINVLSKFYGVQAPIFIDNAESINHIPTTDSQVILLTCLDGKSSQDGIEVSEF